MGVRLGRVSVVTAVGLVMASVVALSSGTAAAVTAPVVATADYPAMFTVAGDGRILMSELSTGDVVVFNPADGSRSTFVTVPDLCTGSDRGLYGLALDPASPARLYAYATRRVADGSCHSQVLRIDVAAQGGPAIEVLLSDPYVGGHIGGRILFGPDGNLYVSTGDGAQGLPAAERAAVQDVASPKGKILRMTPSGAVPAGNPFGNYTHAYGFRNVFGFDFDPSSGRLWATDNGPDPALPGDPVGPGPSGGCNDELNLVVAGRNYGWGPAGSCATPPSPPANSNRDGPDPVLPAFNIEAASGITGARFCSGCGLGPDVEGRLLYVKYDYREGMGEIRAATLGTDRTTVVDDTLVFRPPGLTPLSIERGPDGTLYYSDAGGVHRLERLDAPPTTTTTTTTPSGAGGTPWVTSVTPTRLRSDFSGWVGMHVVVGASDVRVVALGRWVAPGNTGTHTVKLVDGTTGSDVPGGVASVATAGQSPGGFAYADLAAPVELSANRSYYLVSLESAGGDQWYDFDTVVATTSVARDAGVVWAFPSGSFNPTGTSNQAFGPLNLRYVTSTAPPPSTTTTTVAAPGSTAWVTSVAPTRLRQDFTGWVGMQLVVGGSDLQATSLGRWVAPGNTGTHTLKLVDASTGADVAGGSASLNTAGLSPGGFGHAELTSPVVLRANAAYHLVSFETAGGDHWYDFDTEVTTTSVAREAGVVWAFPSGTWSTTGSPGQAFGPLDLRYSTSTAPAPSPTTTTTTTTAPSPPGSTAWVTSVTPTRLRQDFTGWVGMHLVVGPSDLRATALGRWVAPGNTGAHTVKLVDASTGTDVAGGAVSVATAGHGPGAFAYADLAAPVVLRANTAYYLVSAETAGGDQWYDFDTGVATTSVAREAGVVWAFPTGTWNATGSAGQAFGPLSLRYG